MVEGASQGGAGKRLLVLGAGPAQLGLLAAAKQRGLYVVAADRDPAAPGFRYADRRAIVSAEDENAIDRLASAERIGGIVAPGIDWPVGIAARVAERHGLPHPLSPAAARLERQMNWKCWQKRWAHRLSRLCLVRQPCRTRVLTPLAESVCLERSLLRKRWKIAIPCS